MKERCSLCDGLHYGSYSCPFQCDRCRVHTEICEQVDCPRNARYARENARADKIVSERRVDIALNVQHPRAHEAADAFWQYWRENGDTHKHGYYESTWGAINRALRLVGIVPHDWKGKP